MKQNQLKVAIVRSSFFDGSKEKRVYYLVGIFAFTSMSNLYYLVDEEVDPLQCEYKEIESGGFCVQDTIDEDNFIHQGYLTSSLSMMHEVEGTDWKDVNRD